MHSPQDLKKAIEHLRIPDGSDFDLSTEEGVAAYRATWKQFETCADELVKDIVRFKALAAFVTLSKLANKAVKHLEKWRLHAQATTDLWDKTWQWKAKKKEPEGYNMFLSWLGVKGTKEQWVAKEEKELARIAERLGKAHAKLIREYDLLLVEFDALIQD